MKKLFIAIALMVVCTGTVSAAGDDVITGDVNADEKVDINDVVSVINQMAGTVTYAHADVNGDDKVDINDVVAIINIMAGNKPVEKISITEAKGWQEYVYAKFTLTEGASSYNAYVKGGQYADFTKVDAPLVRNYGTYGRVDIPGLKAADGYAIKVVPVDRAGNEVADKGGQTDGLSVSSYDRSGFAHKDYSGVGAYNDDGTLKAGAQVVYVTKNSAKTVKAKLSSGEFTGIQAILKAYEKGNVTTPLAIRFIGLLTPSDIDYFESSEEGLQIKGKAAYQELNITVEGIGDDATIKGFGFLVRNGKSVEFRNLGIIRCMDDGISLDTDNSNIWIHNIDVFYGKAGSGDHAKGDGAIDVKSDTRFVTLSYCHFWDTGKSNMFGMKSESGPNYISYHHNWFDHSDSRHPRVRTMSVHVWNNYFDNCAKYGVGACTGASVFVENNYFLKTKKPILSSLQGTDATGSGTFSGEDGGVNKAYGNYFDTSVKNFKYYTQNNPHPTYGIDAFETMTREEQVPDTVVTRAGNTGYNNFDTDASVMYAYTPDKAEDVPGVVTGWYGAGRLNHGDITHSFADNTGNETTDSEADKEMEAKIDGYSSAVVSIYGEEATSGEDPGNEPGDDPGDQTEGTITCSFAKDGTPSNSFFTVSGNGSNSKGIVTIDGAEYSTCLKIESSTSIKFILSASYQMTLYFGPAETASIKINGVKISGSGNTYSQTLEAGAYELTKDKSVNLFFIKLIKQTE